MFTRTPLPTLGLLARLITANLEIFADLGFAEDIYKLSMLSARQKTEIFD